MNISKINNITKRLIKLGVKPKLKLTDYDRIVSSHEHTREKCELEDYTSVFISEKDR